MSRNFYDITDLVGDSLFRIGSANRKMIECKIQEPFQPHDGKSHLMNKNWKENIERQQIMKSYPFDMLQMMLGE